MRRSPSGWNAGRLGLSLASLPERSCRVLPNGSRVQGVNSDAIPPKLPSVFDLLQRPVTAEIRPAALLPAMVTITYCEASAPHRDEDNDPPRMFRAFSTRGGAPASRSYNDCDRYAAYTGQPYTVDVRAWDAESGFIVERMNHDYSL